MKIIKATKKQSIIKLGITVLAIVTILFSSCELTLQQKVPFNPETPVLATFKNQTAWEWIKTHPGDDFTLMEQAINVTGLQNLYSQVDSQRTYLLLKNISFTQSNGVLQVITGSRNGDLSKLSLANTQRLKNILMYHIINQYVDQGPDNLKVVYKDYFFQTLLPGLNGRVSINRNDSFNMVFNASSILPATKKGTIGAFHNYVLKNGVAHLLTTYIRVTPF